MSAQEKQSSSETDNYPLLIKQLLLTSLTQTPGQEIVYRQLRRYTYRTFCERIGRLAGALSTLGVARGDTVAVLDWDSHRYLECFYAVPMMGAVLQTVNVRLSKDQIEYTIEHAQPKVLLVHRTSLKRSSPCEMGYLRCEQ